MINFPYFPSGKLMVLGFQYLSSLGYNFCMAFVLQIWSSSCGILGVVHKIIGINGKQFFEQTAS